MSRGYVAKVLLVTILSLVLGTLAASDVGGREAALRRQLGAPVSVLVARSDVAAGAALTRRNLAVRSARAVNLFNQFAPLLYEAGI